MELSTLLKCLNLTFDFIALTEIGQNNIDGCACLLGKYNIHYEPSPGTFGGAALLLSSNVEFVAVRDDLNIKHKVEDFPLKIENIWIECKLPCIKSHVVVGVIHRHPHKAIKQFTCGLEQVLQIINKEDKLVFVCGFFI